MEEAATSLFFSFGVVVIILFGTASSVDVDDVSTSVSFRLRCCGRTLLMVWCVDVVGQSKLVVCMLPGTETEMGSVFPLVEVFTFAF